MDDLRELIERYTTIWNTKDLAGFRTMVADGCIRRDPGKTIEISLAENEGRFLRAHEQLPGLRLANAWMWEHGADTITVAFSMTSGSTELAGIEVFRFAGGKIVEVWNAPAGAGGWGSQLTA